MLATKIRYVLTDLYDLPDDSPLFDILGGDLLVRNIPDDNHAELLSEAFGMLRDAQMSGYGRVYTSTRAVALDYSRRGENAEDVPHPDLFFIRNGREGLRGRHALQGVPDLVVEILSPSTRGEHMPGGRLHQAYERNGLPHYWVIDPRARTITQYELIGEPYASVGHFGDPVVLREGDVLSSPLFPTIAVPVARLFERVRRYEDQTGE